MQAEIGLSGVVMLGIIVILSLLPFQPPPISLIHPRDRFAVSPPSGITLRAQARIPPHPDNRWVTIAWDGDTCGGSWGKSLAGDEEDPIIPPEPLTLKANVGICVFVATLIGKDGRQRGQATFEVDIR